MEGGVAILLLLLLALVVGAFMLGFTSLGGALGLRRRTESKEDAEAEEGGRRTHAEPTTPYHENTRFVGAEERVERSEQR